MNGDGLADVLGIFNNNLMIYLGKGDRTFAAGVSYPVGNTSSVAVISIGDFNGDHKPDVAVNLLGSNAEVVLLGNGDGTFQPGKTTMGVPAGFVITADFNADGKLDLVISNPGAVNSSATFIFLGNGDGTFQSPTTAFSDSGALAAADFNGDGKLDLVVEGLFPDALLVEVWLGNGDGSFSNGNTYALTNFSGSGVVLADFNLDGKLDIAAGNDVFLGEGSTTFQGWPALPLPPPVAAFAAVATGDFDKNGTQDVAAIPSNTGSGLYILSNDGTGVLTVTHTYTLQRPSTGIAGADLRSNGNLDQVVASNGGYSVLLGNGDGSFQPATFYPQSVQGWGQILVADFNNDHEPDLAINVGTSVAVLLGNGDGTFAAPTFYFDNGGFLTAADFNGDGKIDLASSGSGLAIRLGNGDGTFQSATFPYTDSLGPGLFAGELNRDNKVDLVAGVQVFLGNGNDAFNLLNASIPASGVNALVDINGDGNLDVVSSSSFTSQTSYGVDLENGDGTFGPFILVVASGGIADISRASFLAVADMNGDGKPDLIYEDALSVFVVLNTTTPVPGVSFSPTVVTFPPQAVGTSSSPTPVILTNIGTAPLTVSDVSFTGANANQFSQTNNCTTLQPAATCTIQVKFSPDNVGNAVANLAISDNAVGSPQSVPLFGTGIANSVADLSIGVGSGSSSSATINPGQQASFNLEVTPLSGFSGIVDLSCSISPVVSPAPTCTLPASVQTTDGNSVPVLVAVATTGPATSGAISRPDFPQGKVWLVFGMSFSALGIAFVRRRRWLPVFAAQFAVLAIGAAVGCGGSSPPLQTSTGTPPGTYTATVSATSGNLKHTSMLTVVVQ